MSQKSKPKVVSTKKSPAKAKSKLAPTQSGRKRSSGSSSMSDTLQSEFIFGKRNYMFMLIGLAMIIIGLLLMMGGEQSNYDAWEPEDIYSFRRITLAPIVILAGFAVEIYAIFTKAE